MSNKDKITKTEVYCSKCGALINEIELHGKFPEALKNHIICRGGCYSEKKLLAKLDVDSARQTEKKDEKFDLLSDKAKLEHCIKKISELENKLNTYFLVDKEEFNPAKYECVNCKEELEIHYLTGGSSCTCGFEYSAVDIKLYRLIRWIIASANLNYDSIGRTGSQLTKEIAELKESIENVANGSGNFEDMLLTKTNKNKEVLREQYKFRIKWCKEALNLDKKEERLTAMQIMHLDKQINFYDELLEKLDSQGKTEKKERCEFCNGSGVFTDADGENVDCVHCEGDGLAKASGGEKEMVKKGIEADSFVDKPESIRLSSNVKGLDEKEGIPSIHSKPPEDKFFTFLSICLNIL